MGMNSIDVGIMMKLHELAERFGIEPHQFKAELRHDTADYATLIVDCDEPRLPGSMDRVPGSQVNQFMQAVTDERGAYLDGSTREILETLCDALHVAPQPRARG